VNPLVSALMTQQRKQKSALGVTTIGLVELLTNVSPPAITHLNRGATAMAEAAARLGYKLDRFKAYDPGMNPRRLMQIVRARGIRGICLLQPPDAPKEWLLDWSEFSVVHCITPQSVYNQVRTDVVSALNLVLGEVQARGYTRPGLSVGQSVESYSGYRWRMAMNSFYVEQHLTRAIPEYGGDWEPRVFSSWKRRYKPDVILGMGVGFLDWLRKQGYRIPEDLGYVDLNMLPSALGLTAGLDTYYDERMKASIDVLDGQLRRNEVGPRNPPYSVMLPCRWVDGPTLRPRL